MTMGRYTERETKILSMYPKRKEKKICWLRRYNSSRHFGDNISGLFVFACIQNIEFSLVLNLGGLLTNAFDFH